MLYSLQKDWLTQIVDIYNGELCLHQTFLKIKINELGLHRYLL